MDNSGWKRILCGSEILDIKLGCVVKRAGTVIYKYYETLLMSKYLSWGLKIQTGIANN